MEARRAGCVAVASLPESRLLLALQRVVGRWVSPGARTNRPVVWAELEVRLDALESVLTILGQHLDTNESRLYALEPRLYALEAFLAILGQHLDTAEPLVDTAEPLVDAVEPLVDAVEPLVDAVEPLAECFELATGLDREDVELMLKVVLHLVEAFGESFVAFDCRLV